MLLVKMSKIKAKGKEQLEELAKKDLGVRLSLTELLIPFNLCNKFEIIQFQPSRKIYYFCNNHFCDECPKQEIPTLGYKKVLAIYENNELHILKNETD